MSWRGAGASAAAWQPDGKALIMQGSGSFLTVVSPLTGKSQATHNYGRDAPARQPEVLSLAYSPDGRQLAMGLFNGFLSLRDGVTLTEGKRLKGLDPEPKMDHVLMRMILERNPSGPECLAFSADGKWLLSDTPHGAVVLWDTVAGAEALRLNGHDWSRLEQMTTLAIGPDGRKALSSGSDGQTYWWDLRPAADGQPQRPLEELWANLASDDAALAYRAIWSLCDNAKAADFLATKIAPAQPIDKAALASHIKDLDSDSFKQYEAARQAIVKMGDQAAQALALALKDPPSLEAQQRMSKLLELLQRDWSPPVLQQMRALKAMELADTPASRQLLQRWADGAPAARLTQEARLALVRLDRLPRGQEQVAGLCRRLRQSQ
jgi:hypothetical protein